MLNKFLVLFYFYNENYKKFNYPDQFRYKYLDQFRYKNNVSYLEYKYQGFLQKDQHNLKQHYHPYPI